MKPPKRFVPGRAYFIVMFSDEELTVPLVQTLIFERMAKRDNGEECLVFRQIRPQEADSKFVVEKQHIAKLLLDEKGLMEKLKKCFEGKLASGSA